MTADLNAAASAILGVPINMQLGTAEAQICPSVGVGTTGTLRLTNTDTTARLTFVSQVKSGGTAGAPGTRIFARALAAGESVYIPFKLGDGDFLSGKCATASVVDAVVDDIVYSASGATTTGIHLDAIGTGGYVSGSVGALTSVSGTNGVGTNPNRKITAVLLATTQSGASSASGYGNYDTFTATCGGAAMTRASVTDIKSGTALLGSVSVWEFDGPTSGSNPTIQANVQKSGLAFNLVLLTISEYGIGAAGAAAIDAPTSAAALNVSLASAVGHRVLFAGAFNDPPNRLLLGGLNAIGLSDGNPLPGSTRPHWLYMAWAPGAPTVAATTANSDTHSGILLDRPAA